MRIFTLLFLFITSNVFAQNCRYFKPIFPTFTKQSNVVYATAQGIPSTYTNESTTTLQNLTVDIFTPNNDTATKRAMIIFAHSGGFLNGTKDNKEIQALCDSFVKCGFITASMNYRKNFSLFSGASSERAVWRATQDASSAVRFFKSNASSYKIDTNKIFFWGSSAGSFMALHLAFTDDNERPASSTTTPNLGCKSCTGTATPNVSDKIAGIISCWGAIGDTNWINANNQTPTLMFHGSTDATVSPNKASPFGLFTLPQTYGSTLIEKRMKNVAGIAYHEYHLEAGKGHEYWFGPGGGVTNFIPSNFFDTIMNQSKTYMAKIMNLTYNSTNCNVLASNNNYLFIKNNNEKNIVLNYINSSKNIIKYQIEYSANGRNWNEIKDINNQSLSNEELQFTFNNPSKSYNNYYRIKTTEINGSNIFSNVVFVQNKNILNDILIAPNPAYNNFNIIVSNAKEIFIQDAIGKTIYKQNGTSISSNYIFNTNNIKAGVYFVKVLLNNGEQKVKQIFLLNK